MSRKSVIRTSKIRPEDLLDRLYKAWATNKIKDLPQDEQDILERMEFADDLIRSGGRYMFYKNVLTDMQAKFPDVCKRTVENDIQRAKRFFLSKWKRDDKEYARGIRVEWLNRIAAKAEEDGEYIAAIAAIKEGNELLALKQDDPDLPAYDQVERQPILVMNDATKMGLPAIDPRELEKLRMSKALYLDAEDVEVEEDEQEADDDTGL